MNTITLVFIMWYIKRAPQNYYNQVYDIGN